MAIPDRHRQRHLHVGVRRHALRVGGAVRRRHAERRAVDRHRRVRLRHRGAAVQAVQRAGRRLRARHHDDSDHRADDRGAAAARARDRCAKARWRSARRARAPCSRVVLPAALPGIITGIVLALARIAGETAPLLFTSFNNRFFTTSLTQPISSLTVQVFTYAISPVRGLAPPGLGRRAGAGDDRPGLLAARALRDPPPRAHARAQLKTTDVGQTPSELPRLQREISASCSRGSAGLCVDRRP